MQVNTFNDVNLLNQFSIPIITVYYNTKDFPGDYVARLFDLDQATPIHITSSELDTIRKKIPQGMTRIARSPEDDPVIVEVYV